MKRSYKLNILNPKLFKTSYTVHQNLSKMSEFYHTFNNNFITKVVFRNIQSILVFNANIWK